MAAYTVTTTAQNIVLPANHQMHGTSAPGMVTVQNTGAATIYLGSRSTVTPTTGIAVLPGQEYNVALPGGRPLWAVTASGSSTITSVVI